MAGRNPPANTPRLYAQDGAGYDAIVHTHYYLGDCNWLITEYDPDEDLAFGWVRLNGDRQNAELGYVSLAELRQFRAAIALNGDRIPNAIAVELDEHWTPCTLTQGIARIDAKDARSSGI
ncbi:MAG TPA: DUF2958 domain-containing protein [Mycobacteriales bacterium]|nr:DUF2958 domain-containing protein [Mycobacteriales bacterium]HWC34160.1 DUF2958 domain-containing protein [Mycobacteriales bacterium]